MKLNPIKVEAVDVKTPTGRCIGIAKIQKGEKFILDGRTPTGDGICTNALSALSNAAFVMMSTEEMRGEKDGAIERICPHGNVVYRLSRSENEKENPFSKK